MPLSPIEKALAAVIADVAINATEMGKTQIKIANFIAQHVETLSDHEKQEILGLAETSWQQVQSLQERAKSLREIL